MKGINAAVVRRIKEVRKVKEVKMILGLALVVLMNGSFRVDGGVGSPLQAITTSSPNHKLVMRVSYSPTSGLRYTFRADGESLVSSSALGLSFGKAGVMPSAGWEVSKVITRSVHKIWKPVWGKSSVVPDRYHETVVELRGQNAPFDSLNVIIRAYNDGIAFRYEIPGGTQGKEARCNKELTTFHFSGDDTAWFYHGEHANIGPVRLTEVDGNRSPVMTIKAGDHAYMAILEADLRTGSPVLLHSKRGETDFSIISAPGEVQPGYKSSWRVILYGRTPGVLIDSHTVQLLNPPPADKADFSWVKPGIAVWDWRLRGAKVDEFEYGNNYPSWIRLVNFAAKNGIPYLLLDGGWYGTESQKEANPLKNGDVKRVKKLIAYAKKKHVSIWLYLNDIALRNYDIEKILTQFSRWGVAGIKVGFMQGTTAAKNTRTRRITMLCAKNHLMCDFHDGPVIPYGQLRNYPNAVTREYCHSQLDGHRFVTPETLVTAVYVNMIAGPLDMDNGIFDLLRVRSNDYFKPFNRPAVPSTITSEAARTLIVFSGLTVLPDIPEDYEKFPTLLSFITSEKMPWRKSKTLMGQIGKYIVMARQATDGTWLVGAATDSSPRVLNIPLSFLGKGKYQATIIQDAEHADYLTNRTACQVNRETVRASDHVEVRLAAGGGACMIIKGQSGLRE